MSKLITTYQQLPPGVKQSINNVAAKAARAAAGAVVNASNRKAASQRRGITNRTRNGQRVYDPSWTVNTKTFAPVAYATTWTAGGKSLRVHQCEVIGRVTANSTWFPSWHNNYSVMTFPINPAHPTTFPWLSYIARLFDKYKFHSLKFMYINSVATTQVGNIVMSLDYDTLDDAPGDVVEASQLAKYKINPMYCPCSFDVPVNKAGVAPWLYTYDLSAGTKDLKTYNLGNLFLSLDGVPQDGKDYGYFAVEYDVELLDKNPISSIGPFASLTWDSGTPALKKDRSSVDPADTMDVEIHWESPAVTADSNPLTISFSSNVPKDSKIRLAVFVVGYFKYSAGNNGIGFGNPDLPDGVELVETNRISGTASSNTAFGGYFNFDIHVPASREVTITMLPRGTCRFEPSETSYSTASIGYSYA